MLVFFIFKKNSKNGKDRINLKQKQANDLNYISNDYYNHIEEGRKKRTKPNYLLYLTTLSPGQDEALRRKLQTNPKLFLVDLFIVVL